MDRSPETRSRLANIRIRESMRNIGKDFLAKPYRLHHNRDLDMMKDIGDIKRPSKFDKLIEKTSRIFIGKDDLTFLPKWRVNFDWDWDMERTEEEHMHGLELIKKSYYSFCSENTLIDIAKKGRPNWWGLTLHEQHRNSPSYLGKILKRAEMDIEEASYQYRRGNPERVYFTDTSYSDITGGGNGEPPYEDPARMWSLGKEYKGYDLNIPTNHYRFSSSGIVYNTRVYDDNGRLRHVEPLEQFKDLDRLNVKVELGAVEKLSKEALMSLSKFKRY